MKIKWLNNERTIARISRGIWPWRKVTVVERCGYRNWQHIGTGDDAEDWLSRAVEDAAIQTEVANKMRDHERRNWSRKQTIPRAEVRR